MPQLDLCTYMIQYNYTVLSFLILYIIIAVQYVPAIGKILHSRKMWMTVSEKNVAGSEKKSNEIVKKALNRK